jgi:hypothetical protein
VPSQVPSVPQEAACWSTQTLCGSATPAATGEQVPSEVERSHLRQLPVQAVAQQTPSAQKVLAHSLDAEQGCPTAFGPQLPFTQSCPSTQSLLLVHLLMQALFAHANGEQFTTPVGRQVPSPSQVPVVFSLLPLHEAATQTVSAAYLAHPPEPSQTPVSPQVEASDFRQTPWGSVTPTSTGPQIPGCPLWLQLTQAPVQALLQQRPSTQYPEAH